MSDSSGVGKPARQESGPLPQRVAASARAGKPPDATAPGAGTAPRAAPRIRERFRFPSPPAGLGSPAMITDPWFYAAAIPAVLIFGISKGGFGGGLGLVAVPLMTLAVGPRQAAAILLPILCVMDLFGAWAYRRRWDRENMAVLVPGRAGGHRDRLGHLPVHERRRDPHRDRRHRPLVHAGLLRQEAARRPPGQSRRPGRRAGRARRGRRSAASPASSPMPAARRWASFCCRSASTSRSSSARP